MAEDVVRRRRVEKDVRDNEVQQIRHTDELHVVSADGERNRLVIAAFDLFGLDRMRERHGCFDAFLQILETRFLVFMSGTLDARQAGNCAVDQIGRYLNLPGERKHVRKQTCR